MHACRREQKGKKGLLQFAALDGFDLNRFYGRKVESMDE